MEIENELDYLRNEMKHVCKHVVQICLDKKINKMKT